MKLSIHVLPILGFLLFIFLFPYLPIQDYPDWLHQGMLFNQLVFHPDTFNNFYSLQGFIPPNGISTLLIGLFTLIIPIEIAGKIFVFATLLLLYCSLNIYFKRFSLLPKMFAAYCSFYLVFNVFFFMGALNFLFGLGLCFFGFHFFTKRDYSRATSILLLMLFFFLCYLSHLFAVFIFALFLLSYCISEKKYTLLINAAIGLIPTIIAFFQYYASRTPPPYVIESFLKNQTSLLLSRPTNFSIIIPFHRFKEVTILPAYLKVIDVLTIGIAVLLVIVTIYVIIKTRRIDHRALSLFLFVIPLMLMPYSLGGLNFGAERFVIPIIICSLAYCSSLITKQIVFRLATYAMIAVAVVSLSYNIYNSYVFNTMITSNRIPTIVEDSLFAQKEGVSPFLHFSQYDAMRTNASVPIFNTGLFTYRAVDSIEIKKH